MDYYAKRELFLGRVSPGVMVTSPHGFADEVDEETGIEGFSFGGGRRGVLISIPEDGEEVFTPFMEVMVQPFEDLAEWWACADHLEYLIDGEWLTFDQIVGESALA
jgi:hypothetical protein